jgi:hypothetical protein
MARQRPVLGDRLVGIGVSLPPLNDDVETIRPVGAADTGDPSGQVTNDDGDPVVAGERVGEEIVIAGHRATVVPDPGLHLPCQHHSLAAERPRSVPQGREGPGALGEQPPRIVPLHVRREQGGDDRQ